MRDELIFEAARQVRFECVKSCCGVDLKSCATDEWRGDIRGLASALIRLHQDDAQKLRDESDAAGPVWYLDCYFYGAMLGEKFPVATYGPAIMTDVAMIAARVAHNFDRMEMVKKAKGQNPLPRDLWPDVERPH